MILDRVVGIWNFVRDPDDADKEQYRLDPTMTGVPMNIQPATAEETAIADGVFGKTFTGFTTQSGIRIGSKVTVSGTGQILKIKGVGDWSSPDFSPHYEYTLVEFEDDELL